jgi:cell filamentation protein
MADPYVYPDTDVLINKEGIREREALETFERLMTLQRMREGIPAVDLSAAGYREIHRHLFQDVYAWAGEDRTINIAKGGTMFCLAPHIAAQLERRFAALRAENGLKGLTAEAFAARAAEHICELNAIHPFREGNGRALRAFLEVLGERAGHPADLQRIGPDAWNDASVRSFRDGDYEPMRRLIAAAITRHPGARP